MSLEIKIKRKCDDKKVSVKKLAEEIGMSDANLYEIFKRDSIETKYLVKIAYYFNVPVGYFFDETDALMGNGVNMTAHGNNNNQSVALNDCHHKVELLEKEVEGMNEQLKLKNEIIEILKNKK